METAQMLLRAAGGLLAVLGTVWLLVRVVRARQAVAGTTPVARLRVLSRVSLGRHSSVVSVDAGDRVLLLGVGETGVRLLAEQPALPAPDPVVVPAAGPGADLGTDLSPGLGATALVDLAGPGRAGLVPVPRRATSGSLVDPGTWRAAVAVAREWTVRR